MLARLADGGVSLNLGPQGGDLRLSRSQRAGILDNGTPGLITECGHEGLLG